jgi:hypothetical protein
LSTYWKVAGRPFKEHTARVTAINPLSMESSARRECSVLDGKIDFEVFFIFCTSYLLGVIGLTLKQQTVNQAITFNAFLN